MTTVPTLAITPEIVREHGLTPEEYEKVKQLLGGREPTITELGIFSVMWSEHCSYKSSRVHLKRLPTRSRRVVQGPGLISALKAAAELGAGLPENVIVSLLQHEASEIRAGGCRCARRSPAAIPLLTKLPEDADRVVAREAACALGRMARGEARPSLLRLLREAPSAAVIDSITAVADEECLVILGRIARTRPVLADAALVALDSIGSSRAVKIAAASRRTPPHSATSFRPEAGVPGNLW